MSQDADFEPSALGTKSYWDSAYEGELAAFSDHGEIGEIWFGQQSVTRVSRWLGQCYEDEAERAQRCILDVGCGNGAMLVKLAKLGFCNLIGVDYSANAVDLARQVAIAEEVRVQYEVGDILDLSSSPIFERSYDVVLDKGTYDAISLHPDMSAAMREQYVSVVGHLLKSMGILIITSCNWTRAELEADFTRSGHMKVTEELPVKQLTFGGTAGQTVTCLVMQKCVT